MEKISKELEARGIETEVAEFCDWVSEQILLSIAHNGSLPMLSFIRMNPEGANIRSTGGDVMIREADEIPDEFSKDKYMESVRYIAHREKSDCVVIASEMWMPPPNADAKKIDRLLKKYGAISKMPGKQEGIVVTLAYNKTKAEIPEAGKDVAYAVIIYVIERDQNGNIFNIRFDKINYSETDFEMKGRMIEMFYLKEDIESPAFQARLFLNHMAMSGMKILIANTKAKPEKRAFN